MARGFDVSNWDAGLNFNNAGIEFLIFKATEGTTFIDRDAQGFYNQCINYGLGCGFYHFAGRGNARAEADFFYTHTCAFRGVPILDYEVNNADNRVWCEQFMERYHEITNTYPMLYISAYRCKEYNGSWIPRECRLWVAGYPYPYSEWIEEKLPPYSISPWYEPTIWQFTSSFNYYGHNLDANICYDMSIFDMQPRPNTSTIDAIAREVIEGKWGNGIERKNRLTAAGYNYDAVQSYVNRLLAPKSVETLAYEVIDGKWGNGSVRRKALTNAGYDYDAVQRRVNQILLG